MTLHSAQTEASVYASFASLHIAVIAGVVHVRHKVGIAAVGKASVEAKELMFYLSQQNILANLLMLSIIWL